MCIYIIAIIAIYIYMCVCVCVCVCVCIYIYIYINTGSLPKLLDCSPMARDTGVQSQVASYQRPKKWYLILFTNTSAWAGYDTRSIFKRSLTGLNSEFSFF